MVVRGIGTNDTPIGASSRTVKKALSGPACAFLSSKEGARTTLSIGPSFATACGVWDLRSSRLMRVIAAPRERIAAIPSTASRNMIGTLHLIEDENDQPNHRQN